MVTMKDHEEKSENNAIYHHNKKNKIPGYKLPKETKDLYSENWDTDKINQR